MRRGELASFYEEPYFFVENPHSERLDQPTVKSNVIKEEFIIFLIAKAGWFGGNPSAILAAPFDIVMKAYYFEIMTRQYQSTAYELNKAKK